MTDHNSVELREVMRRWPSGVAVLTSSTREMRHGMTVNSFVSISVEPPLITVTMNNDTRTKHWWMKLSISQSIFYVKGSRSWRIDSRDG